MMTIIALYVGAEPKLLMATAAVDIISFSCGYLVARLTGKKDD